MSTDKKQTEAKTLPDPSVGSIDLFGDSERNWSEDFSHENGKYMRVCFACGQTFVGHKRRVQCRKCALECKAAWDALPEAEKQKRMEHLKAELACLKTSSPNA